MHSPDSIPELAFVKRISRLMDSQFEVGGFRFGLDPILGLIPGVGDVVSLGVSGVLLLAAVRHGASGSVLARMLLFVFVDLVIGGIPVVGDITDFFLKVNERNYRLLAEHYYEDKHTGPVWPWVLGIFVALLLMVVAGLWLAWKLAAWLWAMVQLGLAG